MTIYQPRRSSLCALFLGDNANSRRETVMKIMSHSLVLQSRRRTASQRDESLAIKDVTRHQLASQLVSGIPGLVVVHVYWSTRDDEPGN